MIGPAHLTRERASAAESESAATAAVAGLTPNRPTPPHKPLPTSLKLDRAITAKNKEADSLVGDPRRNLRTFSSHYESFGQATGAQPPARPHHQGLIN